ncbi:J domain-containing protein [Vibrio sp.]|nr:J domain-containing protein [Vibrio sp.]
MKVNEAFNLLNISGKVDKNQVKKAYKKASIKFHPDKNPSNKHLMVSINCAYDFLKSILENQSEISEDIEDKIKGICAEELQKILDELVNLEGLEIEICGNWIWVTGETKKHKDKLGKNGIGLFYAKKKKSWYYRPSDYKSKSRKSHSMDEIRKKYGSNEFKEKGRKKIAA